MSNSNDLSESKRIEAFNTFKDAGNKQFKAKNYTKAKEFYTKAISNSQDIGVVYSNRAMCNLNLGLYYDALNDCNIAISLDPNLTKAYYRRGVALKELSRYRLALKDFERVIEDEPENDFAKKHIEYIKSLLENDTRLDLKLYPKPENYRSKKPMETFPTNSSKYTGSHSIC